MLKIACIAKSSHPAKLGGVETFQRNLNLILDDYDFRIYAYKTNKEKVHKVSRLIEIDEGNSFWDKLLLKILGRKRYLTMLLRKWNPDIIIINTPNDLKFLKHLKSKIILVQHGSFEAYLNGTFDRKKVVELIRQRLDKYIFLSEYDMQKFNNFLKLPEDRIKSIRHICNIELVSKSGKRNKELVILSRLHIDKRIDLVIKAMQKLPEFSLKVYGDGEEKENLKNLIEKLNLNNVKLMGRVADVKKALNEGAISVMVSDFEGYGIANIEAMRRGLPIILRNTFASARDIVQGNGVLLEKEWNEDKFIEAIKTTYDNYEEYSKKSLELGKRHNIDVIKKEWVDVLKDM